MGLSSNATSFTTNYLWTSTINQIKEKHNMKLNNNDTELLKNTLLNELSGNIATLKGDAKSYINGKEQSALALIDESINDLTELKELF